VVAGLEEDGGAVGRPEDGVQFGPPMGLAGDAGALDIVTKTAAEVFGWPPQVVDQVGVDPGLVFGVDSVGGDLGLTVQGTPTTTYRCRRAAAGCRP
jgi:hypothetical protein